jgi:hypothetical protein
VPQNPAAINDALGVDASDMLSASAGHQKQHGFQQASQKNPYWQWGRSGKIIHPKSEKHCYRSNFTCTTLLQYHAFSCEFFLNSSLLTNQLLGAATFHTEISLVQHGLHSFNVKIHDANALCPMEMQSSFTNFALSCFIHKENSWVIIHIGLSGRPTKLNQNVSDVDPGVTSERSEKVLRKYLDCEIWGEEHGLSYRPQWQKVKNWLIIVHEN